MTKRVEAVYKAALAFDETAFDEAVWQACPAAEIKLLWSGDEAAPQRHAHARVVWMNDALCVRFDCAQGEELVVSKSPQTATKTIGLWNRDVCELFIAPYKDKPHKYFEFEVAPTGEWLDLALEYQDTARTTDWDYKSEMRVLTRTGEDKLCLMLRIEWRAFGVARPHAGDVWRANFYRCAGRDEQTRYLAWSPTFAPKPNFHVPEAFGELSFT